MDIIQLISTLLIPAAFAWVRSFVKDLKTDLTEIKGQQARINTKLAVKAERDKMRDEKILILQRKANIV